MLYLAEYEKVTHVKDSFLPNYTACIDLVEAESREEAVDKVINHVKDGSTEYVAHEARDIDIKPVIK